MIFKAQTALAAVALFALVGCETMEKAPMPAPQANIVGLAVATDDLSTLVAAVQAAGLVDALSGTGPFTVLAPTNDAFAPLGIAAADVPAEVLTAHVIAGAATASDVLAAIEAGGGVATFETLAGTMITARTLNDGLFFRAAEGGPAMVVTGDVMASNGVVHVIDSVLGFGDMKSGRDGMAMDAGPVYDTATPVSAAAEVCGAGGAAVVMWTDSDGEPIEACRREDGVEYALKDAIYFNE